jgi:integral membrane protein
MSYSTALGRYRIMANVVGVMLIFVFLFAHVGHASIVGFRTSENVETVIGPIHGALYVVYCFTVLQVWRQYRLRLWTVAAMVSAGWVPFVAFIAERWVTRHVAVDALAID